MAVPKRRPKPNVIPLSSAPLAESAEPVDFTKYEFRELMVLRRELQEEIERRQSEEITKIREELAARASDLGISVGDLAAPFLPNSGRQTKPRVKGAALFRGPDGREWSGRGPRPQWLRNLIQDGRTIEDFRIS
jgi:DNA-binding protein H-NS